MIKTTLMKPFAYVLPVLALLLHACSDFEGPRADRVNDSDILTRVAINSEAVIMKQGDSINLSATLYSMDGTELTGVDHSLIEWSSASPIDATIDSTGKVIARRVVTAPVSIIAKLEYKGTTKADTIPLYITADSYTATEVRLVALDSNRIGALGTGATRVRIDIYDNENLIIKGARIHIESTVSGVAVNYAGGGGSLGDALFSVQNTASHVGPFYIKVKGNLYGSEISDSLEFTGLYPAMVIFSIAYNSNTGEYAFASGINPLIPQLLQPCAVMVIMVNGNPEPIDLIFSDSTDSNINCDPNHPPMFPTMIQNVNGGNLLGIPVPNPGTFPYMQRRSGGTGLISMRIRSAASKELIGPTAQFDVRTPDQLP